MRTYKHLTREQRYTIFTLLQASNSKKEIINIMNLDKSTFYRELKRHSINGDYDPFEANKMAVSKRHLSKKPVVLTPEIQPLIIEKLQQKWSPEQIAGRFKHEEIASFSHQSVYNWIYKDKLAQGTLYTLLRRKRKYRKHKTKESHIVDRKMITERPKEVNERISFGHWELDTVYSTSGDTTNIVTIVERVSRYTCASLLENRNSLALAHRVCRLLKNKHVASITSDNGTEFASHKVVSEKLKTDFYFALPYHPWERGTNENTNGLLRQYLPSGKSLKGKNRQLSQALYELNNRPRKCLNYRTPKEVFDMLMVQRE